MKILQKPEFQHITITIETSREAEMLWQAIRDYPAKGPVEIEFYQKVSNWFSNEAQL